MGNPPRKRKRQNRKPEPIPVTALEPHPDAYEDPEEQAHTEQEKQAESNMLKKIYQTCFSGKSATWSAIFTAALVLFSALLYKVSREANQTSIATQRAFISFMGMGGWEKIQGPQSDRLIGYSLHLPMINSGTTPTKYAIYEISLLSKLAG